MSNNTKHFPNITASNLENFQKLEEKVKALPQIIIDRIEHVGNGVAGTTLTWKKGFYNGEQRRIYLPNTVSNISCNEDGSYDAFMDGYYFSIPSPEKSIDGSKPKLVFMFIDIKEQIEKEKREEELNKSRRY